MLCTRGEGGGKQRAGEGVKKMDRGEMEGWGAGDNVRQKHRPRKRQESQNEDRKWLD